MKKFYSILLILMLVLTFGICIIKPIMHKEFSFGVVDYLIKFNTDGSVTTIKQTTTTSKEGQ